MICAACGRALEVGEQLLVIPRDGEPFAVCRPGTRPACFHVAVPPAEFAAVELADPEAAREYDRANVPEGAESPFLEDRLVAAAYSKAAALTQMRIPR